jgi:hypothetical protein
MASNSLPHFMPDGTTIIFLPVVSWLMNVRTLLSHTFFVEKISLDTFNPHP